MAQPRKVLFILIDGLGDTTTKAGMTPLQAAHTPTFDLLAKKGLCGLMDPVEAGIACGSDTAHLSILGYDPRLYYQGRGAFETLGTGLAMGAGDIAFKCVFAYLDRESQIVKCRRADRHFEDAARALTESLDGITIEAEGNSYSAAVKYATEHRCGVCIRGPNLSAAITGTDPLRDNLPLLNCEPLNTSEDAKLTCKVIRSFSKTFQDTLESHPINLARVRMGKPPGNVVLFRGPGGLPSFPSFSEMHGMKAFMIAPTCIISGVGIALGMEIIKVPGATGNAKSNFTAKFITAVEILSSTDYDFGFVHIKAVDEASHSGMPAEKKALLEQIDRALVLAIPNIDKDGFLVVLTGDHTTPSQHHFDHTHHPVPFLISNLKHSEDPVDRFDELSIASGSLGRFTGLSVMNLIKTLRLQ